jgi:hypothetical protein
MLAEMRAEIDRGATCVSARDDLRRFECPDVPRRFGLSFDRGFDGYPGVIRVV